MKKKTLILVLVLIGIILIAGFTIPKKTHPSADTRIILEHNKSTYIAPSCFEQSDPTNFLEDAELQDAEDLNYEANGACTEDAFESEQDSLVVSLLKDIGILDKKWDNI
ncbi:hypothetical protein KFZ58_08015 [Virgibacillus sp. NKC19-16]|uniref:hypothetical protein n=1 Tax=Virgibacillus salidurans TaxID=2831673 RepID=UPI001F41EE1A|nr:hypothetical protein [Virgibacillus sp. NKC19-16]UJL47785.1 hypothetical protein KFZ58_08015 [Virgibacillus sp. NKC19-16]